MPVSSHAGLRVPLVLAGHVQGHRVALGVNIFAVVIRARLINHVHLRVGLIGRRAQGERVGVAVQGESSVAAALGGVRVGLFGISATRQRTIEALLTRPHQALSPLP